MARKGWLAFILYFGIWVIVLPVSAQVNGEGQTPRASLGWYWPVGTIILLLLIIAGLLWYLYRLQRQIFDALQKKGADGETDRGQLEILFQYPLGLPAGTVRSMLAMLIVIISLCLIVIQTFIGGVEFPAALTAVLGTVLGFYFGARSTAREQEEALRGEIKESQSRLEEVARERDAAMEEKEASEKGTLAKADAIVADVKTGIAWTKEIAEMLPGNIGKKYIDKIEKVEQGVKAVEKITGVAEKVTEAAKVLEVFKSNNPVREIIEKASQSFGRTIGGAIPALGLISAVVGVSAKLGQNAYQRWKARILHLPFSPAVTPLQVVDANTCFVLFLKSPILKAAFSDALSANDRPLIKEAADGFIREADTEALWQTYHNRFESRAQFEAGLEEFRLAAADLGLKQDIDAELLKGVGDYDKLMASLDRIDANAEAQADLHQLVTIIDGLKQKNEPVLSIFEKAQEEMSS
jgi:hypothetical protein